MAGPGSWHRRWGLGILKWRPSGTRRERRLVHRGARYNETSFSRLGCEYVLVSLCPSPAGLTGCKGKRERASGSAGHHSYERRRFVAPATADDAPLRPNRPAASNGPNAPPQWAKQVIFVRSIALRPSQNVQTLCSPNLKIHGLLSVGRVGHGSDHP